MTDTHPSRASRRFDVSLTWSAIAVTLAATTLFAADLARIVERDAGQGRYFTAVQYVLFGLIIAFLVYGNLVYQFARLGHLVRQRAHRPATDRELEAFACQ